MREETRGRKTKWTESYTLEIFKKVKAMMQDEGMTRDGACKALNIPREMIYKKFSTQQKREIDEIYYSGSDHVPHHIIHIE